MRINNIYYIIWDCYRDRIKIVFDACHKSSNLMPYPDPKSFVDFWWRTQCATAAPLPLCWLQLL